MAEAEDIFSIHDSDAPSTDLSDSERVPDVGWKLELKKYDVRTTSTGQQIVLQTGLKYDFYDVENDSQESAIVVTKSFSAKNILLKVEINIRSPYIVKALKAVVPWYPNVNLDGDNIVIVGPPHCLFHYYQELLEYGNRSYDDDALSAKGHIDFAVNYMKDVFASDLRHYRTCLQTRDSNAGLDWDRLWMAYRPGDMVFCRENDELYAGRLLRMDKRDYVYWGYWDLELERIVCTGAKMVYQTCEVCIDKYSGLKQLKDLHAYPLRYHRNQGAIREKLIKRGKQLFSLRGVHQKYYRGHADWARDPAPGREDYYEEGDYPFTKFQVRSRIMIDVEAFNEHRPNHNMLSTHGESRAKPGDNANDESDDNYIICDRKISGFSLTDKRWCAFNLDLIQSVEYSGSAFNALLLPTELKATLLSLVEVHTNKHLQFGDLVQDKGKGMIFLLHGEPGTGKTLTAESICDYVERPLYPLRSGDLGISAESLEASLTEAFELGERWNAIILLDEADVFLEIRRRNELLRNSLVAVFLRALEYYEGIMFLTTNRIDSFDPAFKSRIHLSLKYPRLCREYRRELWSNFIKTGVSDDVDPSVQNANFLDRMAEHKFNGRQIRNVVRTAYALSVNWDEELSDSHILTTLSAMNNYDNLSDEASDSESDQEESSTKRPSKRLRVD
jgi:hypothetical protein